MENDEVVIDLRVLMWEILRKWHIILVVCVIFAIASGMFGMHKNKTQSVEVSPEDLYEQLKPAEIVKVNNLVAIQKRIDEKSEYEKNSIYMSLNAYDVDVARTDFILSKNPDNKYIRQMYITYMFEGGLYNDIIKEYPDDISLENLSELIRIMISDKKVNVNEDSEENYYKGNDLNRFISVKILGKDKKQCQELQSLVIKNVKQYEKNIQRKYDNHSIEEAVSSVYKAVDTDISYSKNTYDSQMYSLYNEYQSLYNALSDTQISLFDELLSEEKESEPGEEPAGEKTEPVQPASGGISLKYIIVGILAGGFLSVVVIVIITMFNGKIFVQRQITDRGMARVFGTFGRNKNNIASIVLGDIGTDKTSQLDIIVAKVNVYCKKNEVNELVIIDNCMTETGKSRMKNVIDTIQKSGINCKKVTLSEGDSKYTELCDKNNIVVIEELGKGTLKALEYMFTQLKDLESKVCGVICVQ
ncbi:MAG: hypothetical protein HFH68_02750 [Lachnospiraceae bacterium]|nr:hypothetical protein [Lachnospiraceae bacterium]